MNERQYFVVLQTQISSDDEMQKYRAEHVKYLEKFANAGEVFAAGRFIDGSGGMIVLHVDSMERAEQIASRDPYIIHNIRRYGLKVWKRRF